MLVVEIKLPRSLPRSCTIWRLLLMMSFGKLRSRFAKIINPQNASVSHSVRDTDGWEPRSSVGAESRGNSPRYFWISHDHEGECVGGVASFCFPTLLFGSSSLLCLWSDLGEIKSDGFMGALGLLGILCNWILTVTVPLMCDIKPTDEQRGRQQGLAQI